MLGIKLAQTPVSAWWPAGATFAADFTLQSYMRAGIWVPASAAFSFARASAAWADDRSGYWREFGVNAPRLTDRGLLLEPTRHNSIRNSAMGGASVGTPGALPTSWIRFKAGVLNDLAVVGTGTEQGLDYIDVRLWGVTTGISDVGLNLDSTIAVTPGDVYAASAFAKVISGSLSGVTFAQLSCGRFNSGSFVSSAPTVDIRFSSTWEQLGFTDTIPVGVNQIRPTISFRMPDASTVDAVVRIGRPQVEFGATSPSTPIKTTGSPATRLEEVLTLDLPAGSQELTIVFEDQTQQVIGGLAGGSFVVPTNLSKSPISRLFAMP